MADDRSWDEDLERIRRQRLRELEAAAQLGRGAAVLQVSDATFSDIVQKNPFIVIDFWAEWCGPCRMVSPVIGELAAEFAGRVAFGKCNVDENPRIAAGFGISAIPTLLFFANGMLVDRVIGAQPKEAIRSRVLRAFGSVR